MLIDLRAAYIIINDTPAGSTPQFLRTNAGRTFWLSYDALITNDKGKVDIRAGPHMVKIPHVIAMGNMNSRENAWIPEELDESTILMTLVVNCGLKHEIYEFSREFLKNYFVYTFTNNPILPSVGNFTRFETLRRRLNEVIKTSIRCGDVNFLKRVSFLLFSTISLLEKLEKIN